MFPLAFVAGSLQGHWWGFISRNYVVWPIFSLMNVFIALKGTQFLNFTSHDVAYIMKTKFELRVRKEIAFKNRYWIMAVIISTLPCLGSSPSRVSTKRIAANYILFYLSRTGQDRVCCNNVLSMCSLAKWIPQKEIWTVSRLLFGHINSNEATLFIKYCWSKHVASNSFAFFFFFSICNQGFVLIDLL